MPGPTLVELREFVEALAVEGGEYFVACGRTGDRPIPAAGKRFPTRDAARSAVRATELYRARLRERDPGLPNYDPIVRRSAPPVGTRGPGGNRSTGSGTSDLAVDPAVSDPEREV